MQNPPPPTAFHLALALERVEVGSAAMQVRVQIISSHCLHLVAPDTPDTAGRVVVDMVQNRSGIVEVMFVLTCRAH